MSRATVAPERLVGLLRSAAVTVLVVDLAVVGALLWPGLIGEPARAAWRLVELGLTAVLAALLLVLLQRLARALRARHVLQQRQQALFDAMPTGLVLWGPDGRLEQFNADFARLYAPMADQLVPGVRFEALMQTALDRQLVPEAAGQGEAWLARRLEEHRNPGAPMVRRLADGRWRRIVEQRLPDGSTLGHSVDITDIVEQSQALEAARQEAERARQRLEDAFEAIPAGLELYDTDDRLVMFNSALKAMYPSVADLFERGLPFSELVRANWERGGLTVPGGDFDAWLATRLAQRGAGGPPRLHEQRTGFWVRTYERATREGGVVGVRIDVSELMRRDSELQHLNARLDAANTELRRQADTDPLTGCANRRRFERELAASIAAGESQVLLMMDIDHFKRFNDHHGHPAGDACLRRVAGVLTAALRSPRDLCARIGGEEFAVLLPGEGAGGGIAAAQRCLDLLAEAAIKHGDSPLGPYVSLSIGIASQAGGSASSASLVEAADAALYEAKRAGRARWQLA